MAFEENTKSPNQPKSRYIFYDQKILAKYLGKLKLVYSVEIFNFSLGIHLTFAEKSVKLQYHYWNCIRITFSCKAGDFHKVSTC